MTTRDPLANIPDVRDGLTRKERVVLWQLRELQLEQSRRDERRGRDPSSHPMGERSVDVTMLYGRVTEHIDISIREMQQILQRLGGLRA